MSERIRVTPAPYNPGWYLLLGITYRCKRYYTALGWEWIRGIGCPGCYRTDNPELAHRTAAILGREVEA